MAVRTYRFQLEKPGVDLDQIASEVGFSITVSDDAGGAVIDIECEEANYTDLEAVMGTRGYKFVEGDPVTTADAAFRTSASLVGVDKHKILRQLIHFIETNSPGAGFGAGPLVSEVSGGTFPTSETWYETAAKTKKICRWEGTYNANKTLATEKWIVYQDDGVNPAADATDTIGYSGVVETSRSRVIVEH
jgi:hypothetical protein